MRHGQAHKLILYDIFTVCIRRAFSISTTNLVSSAATAPSLPAVRSYPLCTPLPRWSHERDLCVDASGLSEPQHRGASCKVHSEVQSLSGHRKATGSRTFARRRCCQRGTGRVRAAEQAQSGQCHSPVEDQVGMSSAPRLGRLLLARRTSMATSSRASKILTFFLAFTSPDCWPWDHDRSWLRTPWVFTRS